MTTERRGRTTEGTEVELDTWRAFSSKDLLSSLVVERMLAGVAARRHVDVAEPVGTDLDERSSSLSKSAISRRFVAATKTALAELMARGLKDLDVAVLMIDGLEVAGQCCVVALVITTDGTKVPVGLWLGNTENKTVVTNLLADLITRAVGRGRRAVRHRRGQGTRRRDQEGVRRPRRVQRCTLHKRRNLGDHLPRSWPRRLIAGSPSSLPIPIRTGRSVPPSAWW